MTSVVIFILTTDALREQVTGGSMNCADRVQLLNNYEALAAITQEIVPTFADCRETLTAIPALMRRGSYHRERSRLLTLHLHSIEDDTKQRLHHRAEELAVAGLWWAFAVERVLTWRARAYFLALHAFGWLFRWRVPVRFAWLATSTERLVCNPEPTHSTNLHLRKNI